jgi:hypothetical protein
MDDEEVWFKERLECLDDRHRLVPSFSSQCPIAVPPFACTRSMPTGTHMSWLSKALLKLVSGLRTRTGIGIGGRSICSAGAGAQEAGSDEKMRMVRTAQVLAEDWEAEGCVHHQACPFAYDRDPGQNFPFSIIYLAV